MTSLARRIFAVLFGGTLVVCALVMLFCGAFYSISIRDVMKKDISQTAHVMCAVGNSEVFIAKSDLVSWLKTMSFNDMRITFVSKNGEVLYDSEANALSMPNHKDRPEIAAARKKGKAFAERKSATVGYTSIYYAVRLSDGAILRVSKDFATFTGLLIHDISILFGIFILLACACWFIAKILAQKLVAPILTIDPSDNNTEAPYEELKPLINRLSEQQTTLNRQMHQLEAAADIRRQYTSNVTHELKTPIASISGAAELIENGLVRAEDIPDFARRIHSDSLHLKDLVNDILILSRLDESEKSCDLATLGSLEPCDLACIAKDVTQRLQSIAKAYKVQLKLGGDHVVIKGFSRLIDEIINNLVSNAIRYNKPNGFVYIQVGSSDEGPFVEVQDSGIGVAEAEQEKIFARFYRVDISRSRQSGGTGLGLAIVKHAAAVHHAQISLSSVLNEGTTIRVTFPKSKTIFQNSSLE